MITIYTQPSCEYCKQLKEYLKAKGIEFEELDVTEDRAALHRLMTDYKVRATPFLVAGEKTHVGFSPAEIDELLAGGK